MTNHLIIIRGPAGIGKTTIAKILAERMGVKYISIDDLLAKAKLGRVDTKLGCVPLANFLAVQEDVLSEIEKQIEKSSVIVEGNFYFKEQIDFFEKVFRKNILVVTLKAKLLTCIQRDLKRKNPIGKKSTEEVYDLVSGFDAGMTIDVEGKARDRITEMIQGELRKSNQNN